MILKTWKLTAVCITLSVFATATPVLGQVTYVDAVGGAGGNTVRASDDNPDEWFSTVTAADGKWRLRADQGNGGIYETPSSSTQPEDAVEIKTTVTGLANALYDVYVFFRSDSGANDWKIRAGLTSNPGANPLYARTSADGATAGTLALSGPGALTFAGAPPIEDNPQLLYYATIGQFNVTTGDLSVFIDDLPSSTGTILNNRSWYEGIGYALPSMALEINSVASGLATDGSTWSNGQPATAGNNYNVLNSHVVTVDSPFAGARLTAKPGGAVQMGSGVDIRYLQVEAGGNVTMAPGGGDFKLGDELAALTLGFFETAQDLTFNVNPNSDFILALSVLGTGNLDFNTTGAGSELILADAQSHGGTIRFNGTGDGVRLVTDKLFNRLEMNSTGANTLTLETTDQINAGRFIFNQAGKIDHATTVDGSRLVQGVELEVNGALVVDLTKGLSSDERRLIFTDDFRGSANLTINGMSTDPTNSIGGSNGITLNEFEIGSSGEPATIRADSYSGEIAANDYVNVELRHSLKAARIVVNQNAVVDVGHQVVNTAKVLQMGEMQINAGGKLEVGFEQTIAGFAQGRHVAHLELVNTDGRAGTLTLANGSRTVMQVNGKDANQFDTINAQGGITLDGTLEVVVNPLSTNATVNPVYAPTLGDVITLMTATGAPKATDFNDSGTVDGADLSDWRTAFVQGVNAGDADADGDTDGADFLAWQRDVGSSAGGGITGNFDSFVVTDPDNVLAGAGLAFQLHVTSSEVNLLIVAAGGVAAVPEPASALLGAAGAVGLAAARRRVPRGGFSCHQRKLIVLRLPPP